MDWIKIVLFAIIILQELQIAVLNNKNIVLENKIMVLGQMMTALLDKDLSNKVIIEDKRQHKSSDTDKKADD